MIRFDQRTLDVQGTERVFKKVVHSGQNAIRLVDKDGIPMRPPNTLALARLHSNYTISPRGVPTRKSSHSYSGQLAQDKMQNLVNSLETSSQEMASYNSLHSYPQGHGLSSAGSSRHYLSTAGSNKKKSYAPTRSVKSMNKSASSQRTRHLVSAPAADQLTDPSMDNHNESPQGKRLGKEWSALSQCRALKRSSEIVSHRVDRMYFMTGSKLPIQSKYHVEDNELQQLRDLQQARTSSRNTRSGHSRKGEVYRPDITVHSVNGDTGSTGDGSSAVRQLGSENGHKENKDPQILVSQKVLQPKPSARGKSPLVGWTGAENSEKSSVVNGNSREVTHHETGKEEEKMDGGLKSTEPGETTNAIDGNERDGETDIKANMPDRDVEYKGNEENVKTGENKDIVLNGNDNAVTESENEENVDGRNTSENQGGEKGTTEELSVHRDDEQSVVSDKDKIDIKSEDYLQ